MNDSTATKSLRQCPLHQALVGGSATDSNGGWHFQPFLDEPGNAYEPSWASLWLTGLDHNAPWLALPLGSCDQGSSSNALTAQPSQAEWEAIRPDLGALPDPSPLRCDCDRELDQLEQALQMSCVVHFEDGLWWLVPCSTWRPASALIADHGVPSPEILKDWTYQRSLRPGAPSMTLVSPNGLLVSLSPLVDSLRDRLAAQKIPSIENWVQRLEGKHQAEKLKRIRWPIAKEELESVTDPSVNATPSKTDPVLEAVRAAHASSPRPRATNNKRKATGPLAQLRNHKKLAGVTCALAATILVVAFVSFRGGSDAPATSPPPAETITDVHPSQPLSDSLADQATLAMNAETLASEPSDPSELSTTALNDQSMPQPDFQQLLDSLDLSTADRSSLAATSLSFANTEDQGSLAWSQSKDAQGGLDLDRILQQSLSAGRPTMEQVDAPETIPSDDGDGDAEAMEGNESETDAEMDAVADAGHTPQLDIGFSHGPTRTEFKFGRGVIVRNSLCNATLAMVAEGSDEVRDDWIVEPSGSQSAQGNGLCEWRVAKEDTDPELVVQLLSRPGNRWLLITRIGVRTARSEPPVLVSGNDVTVVLQRLATYRRWLSESIDLLRNSSRPPRSRGMPDIGSQIRWMQSQLRETEKAIQRWSAAAELCDTFFADGKLKIELSVTSPKP